MVWKFCEKAHFPYSSRRFRENCTFPQNFDTIKLGETMVFYAVKRSVEDFTLGVCNILSNTMLLAETNQQLLIDYKANLQQCR